MGLFVNKEAKLDEMFDKFVTKPKDTAKQKPNDDDKDEKTKPTQDKK